MSEKNFDEVRYKVHSYRLNDTVAERFNTFARDFSSRSEALEALLDLWENKEMVEPLRRDETGVLPDEVTRKEMLEFSESTAECISELRERVESCEAFIQKKSGNNKHGKKKKGGK